MKPFKSGIAFSKWLMRIAILALTSVVYYSAFETFNLRDLDFIIAAAFLLFSVLLIIGGFLRKSSLTVISALLLLILSVFELITKYSGGLKSSYAVYFLVIAISFYFISKGNEAR